MSRGRTPGQPNGARIAARIAVSVALVLALLVLAGGSAARTALTLGALAIAGLVWLGLRRPEAAASLVSLVLTIVLTYDLGGWLDATTPGTIGGFGATLALWAFAVVVTLATGLAPRHRGNRAVTVVAGHALLVASSAVALVNPSVVPLVGFAAAMAVVLWRSRPRRWLPEAYALNPAELARGAGRTREVLESLAGKGFELLGPQYVDRARSRRVEQLVRRADRLLVVETRQWDESIALVDVEGIQAYALGNDPLGLATRLEPIAALVRDVRRQIGARVDGLVVLWDAESLPGKAITLELTDRPGDRNRVALTLARGTDLPAVLANPTDPTDPTDPTGPTDPAVDAKVRTPGRP